MVRAGSLFVKTPLRANANPEPVLRTLWRMDGSSCLLAFDLSADKSGRLFADIAPWLIVLVGVVLVGGVLIFLLRRWLRSDQHGASGGFTLQDLRELHREGELSDEEF